MVVKDFAAGRRSKAVKRMLAWAAALVMAAVLCSAAAEGAAVPPEAEARIAGLLADGWMPQNAEPAFEDGGSYWRVTLTDRDSGMPAAEMRLDKADPSAVIYYRRADAELPRWPNESGLWGFDLPGEEERAFTERWSVWRDWADGIMAGCAGEDRAARADLLHAAEADCALFADCFDGELGSVLLCRFPAAEGETPEVLAYVDVATNPSSGYDGYMTGGEALQAALTLLRARFGDDVADHLAPDYCVMVIYDGFRYTDLEELDHPIWIADLLDPRADEDGDSFVPGFEDAYEYRIVFDAYTREVLVDCEAPESFGRG